MGSAAKALAVVVAGGAVVAVALTPVSVGGERGKKDNSLLKPKP